MTIFMGNASALPDKSPQQITFTLPLKYFDKKH